MEKRIRMTRKRMKHMGIALLSEFISTNQEQLHTIIYISSTKKLIIGMIVITMETMVALFVIEWQS